MLSRVSYRVGNIIRETGQAMDRLGLKVLGSDIYQEQFSRHRRLMNLDGKKPLVTEDGFIAPNATVIGDVEIGNHASVWYNCVIKGDLNPVRIALYANVQDNTVIHTSDKEYTGVAKGVQVGSFSTIGHSCSLHSCTIENYVNIGMGSTVMEGALLEDFSILGAGSVVLPGHRIPTKEVWAGNPAVYVRNVTDDEIKYAEIGAEKYGDLGKTHAAEFLPYGIQYQHAEKETAV